MWMKWLSCHAAPKTSEGVTPEMNLGDLLCAGDEASEGINPGFETQGRRHPKSKIGTSVTTQKSMYTCYQLPVLQVTSQDSQSLVE